MSWRKVVVTNKCKLSYKEGYMIIRNEETNMIHISEIHTLVIDTTATSITTHLLSELVKSKVKIIFCDEKRLPYSEIVPYYGSHNSSKKIRQQIHWEDENKILVWTEIIRQKIKNQSILLRKHKYDNQKLNTYIDELQFADVTNREGHASKVYFNKLFGHGFTRDDDSGVNAALNYGYSILLSSFSKEIVSLGYLTQLGFMHRNEYNHFNLASDLMEPFRVLVDELVYKNKKEEFNLEYKVKLISILDKKMEYKGSQQYISNIIPQYLGSIFKAVESSDINELHMFEYL
ncbi:CRISPR-associated protein Cas1 [Breznakia sp. PF5-3]|uniref:type II CRISPR-associated endonuclease Cas1 n=1 Tax=unclassified Breznakia TaxID=2623764 RepID=UPI002406D38A|nr:MULTISPECIES: type II CRISPR-associated endonuclease Cas1 [unclassified Breznakia]MDF9824449.1 CRISPR-associated protein Cas1 [Breznakia sp. PM6-1]MDF9835268.1 CRISPR-associated protein Cas1 [Breznakia sp. PF5-3]MDF9837404.1 CRISPR-associated protein Cas1 [Breznakia sp. PFB2-8]MDF9859339.1 CRISPR-associated protein Cas1 [Breznakia sp. PH5-24]